VCATINNVNRGLGQAATCHSSPSTGTLVLAGVLAAAGLFLLTWRWLVGQVAGAWQDGYSGG
jgi:hypothetical protein